MTSIKRDAIGRSCLVTTALILQVLHTRAAPTNNWPAVVLSNGVTRLVAYEPRAEGGYYVGTRFDRSSLLGDIVVGGHRFLVDHHDGPHDPRGHDHVSGPAEEFDLETPPPGFADAGVGGSFLKIGVGALRRPDDRPYFFGRGYDLVDPGVWHFATGGTTSVVYRHTVDLGGRGLGYVFERRLVVADDGLQLTITRSLRNTGSQTLRTRHYAHNFVRIDGHIIGRDYRIELPFTPQPSGPRPLPAAGSVENRSLGFVPAALTRTFWVCLSGYDRSATHNRATVRHLPTGAAVTFATDRPLADFRIYANGRILCPEPFVDLELAPDENASWRTEIRFELPH